MFTVFFFCHFRSKKELHNYSIPFNSSIHLILVSVHFHAFFIDYKWLQIFIRWFSGSTSCRSPTFVQVVDGFSVVIFHGAIGDWLQFFNDHIALGGAGCCCDHSVQGRLTVLVRHVRVRAVAQQQIDDFNVTHPGRAVQRRRFHAAGARVHVRAVFQQNLAHAEMSAPCCVM